MQRAVCAQVVGFRLGTAHGVGDLAIGWQRFADSTVAKRINESDRPGAADGFLLWTKGVENGQKVSLPRLEARRQKEKALFLTP